MYKKRNSEVNTLEEYVKSLTGGLGIADLNIYKPEYRLKNLGDAAGKITSAIASETPIIVYADYDVDGITSGGILGSLIRYYASKIGKNPKVHVKIPGRISDGYGVNMNFIPFMRNFATTGLLITIDNGISAVEEIAAIKAAGWDVVILDHHLGRINDKGKLILPMADVIVDPEAMPEGNDFAYYCGAGIALKLCELMLSSDHEFIEQMTALAALATVADVMPLVGDNRQIVQNGLKAMNSGNVREGLKAIINYLNLTGHVTAEDIAFAIAPVINASSRLYDNGGNGALGVLLATDTAQADEYASRMIAINQQRKNLVKEAYEKIKISALDKVNFVATDAPHGIIGLIAGKLAEEYPKPTFVYAEHDGICSGSARSDDENVNNVKDMLDSCKDLFIRYGGHPGAAGFSFKAENTEKIKAALSAYPVIEHTTTEFYDLDAAPQDIAAILTDMDKAQPFGKGLPAPVFRIDCDFGNSLEYWHAMGSDGSHIRIDLPGGYKAVGFGMKDAFMNMGRPKKFSLFGSLKWNWWNDTRSPQMLIDAIQ